MNYPKRPKLENAPKIEVKFIESKKLKILKQLYQKKRDRAEVLDKLANKKQMKKVENNKKK